LSFPHTQGEAVKVTATTATTRQEPQEEEEAADVRLGDASLAAPFTAKSPSIACVADLLRQGRASLARAQQQAQQGIAYALSNLLYHFVLVRWAAGVWVCLGCV